MSTSSKVKMSFCVKRDDRYDSLTHHRRYLSNVLCAIYVMGALSTTTAFGAWKKKVFAHPRSSSHPSNDSVVVLFSGSSRDLSKIGSDARRLKEEQVELTNEEIARYSRHLVLSTIGMAGQKRLKNSSVLVIGAGGLGSPCLLYLAAAGVGHIGIVDADTVSESNLQRQIIHGTSTIGRPKCQSAADRIRDINPHVALRLYQEEFTADSALQILNDGFLKEKRPWDVVVDGSDNFPTKYLINDACDIAGLPWVYSAILAFEGQLSVFNYEVGVGPTYRDFMPEPPPPGDVPSCAEGGVLGVLPGTMGCLQATEVIKILLAKGSEERDSTGKKYGDVLSGRVLVFNALAMRFSEVGLARLEGREKVTELIDYQGFCAGPQKTATTVATPVKTNADGTPIINGRTMDETDVSQTSDDPTTLQTITPEQALMKLRGGWLPWVLDVRLETEHDIVALPFTDEIVPHRNVRVDHIPKTGEVLVYCKAGRRSKMAIYRLIELGIDPSRLYSLDGGIMRWQQDVDPSMPRY